MDMSLVIVSIHPLLGMETRRPPMVSKARAPMDRLKEGIVMDSKDRSYGSQSGSSSGGYGSQVQGGGGGGGGSSAGYGRWNDGRKADGCFLSLDFIVNLS